MLNRIYLSRLALLLCLIIVATGCDSDSSEDKGEVIITDLTEGTGDEIGNGITIVVEYVGRFTDGVQFDSTEESGRQFRFTLGAGQVLKGWDQGLIGMKVGGVRRLEIPSHLAFGKNGQTLSTGEVVVPPNTDVEYDVTLIDIFDEVITQDIIVGDGEVAELGDVLVVDYIGQYYDDRGQVFDASSIGGSYFIFTLGSGSVIQGWDVGLQGMAVGTTRTMIIPPFLAYGAFGQGTTIPPYTILFFTVKLVDLIKNADS
ncbi:MAG: FKBP-type peptidyl-prolyl cis-trans isomerase [Bacteroidetes Order II. Incertae sedis bacterium]|jgi:FKBP-type peptidyl-prolyl cis-trans isomerase|nr:FKBP-type peptidyl-prolyl cis-trans isomerase [Bacteroidetes Order II. bacterium]MBT4052286.1 FKBP-type peptidyl-prolyl cis-trans isomerase [Bacteroidetes Order II. bacterium]MBT5250333.1 FKBP-type peptidyl-prolyl cis-trans isomerase [Bacteroidetes Order II. bacterium]MBT6201905.1 FKBP-type peptidyl-prolyl cis-trans isomerase [Bacteroidetes Order II. bacterium]MBT6599041.1 FKBP-type peptidyl-prolyl cis-trans isomerase [Bacteroidetes Order II. bacterium]